MRVYAEKVLRDDELCAQVRRFVADTAAAVRVTTLGQKLVQLTLPGVPDAYQGCESVALSLVDPDNRRPVDFDRLAADLAGLETGPPRGLAVEKLLVTSRALRLRRAHAEWFGAGGSYAPVATGTRHALAFCRAGAALTVATRLGERLAREGGWGSATLRLPPGRWRDELTGAVTTGEATFAELLRQLPVALLVRDGAPG